MKSQRVTSNSKTRLQLRKPKLKRQSLSMDHRSWYLIRSTRSKALTTIVRIYVSGRSILGHESLQRAIVPSLVSVRQTALEKVNGGLQWRMWLTPKQANKLRQIGFLVSGR